MSKIQDSWSVGQLATAAGVTVRTLHHYDQIDLLIASGRTASGHRRYSERDVKRLYEITAMRQLGLPLSEIPAVLDSDDDQLSDTVHRQLERVEAQLATTTRLRDQLTQLTRALHEGATPTVHEFINTTELTNMNVRIDRIMTKAGDTGDTSLADASRIPKNDPRLDAIGDVDELNANLGVVIDLSGTRPDVTETLLKIQNDLFDIGGDLAHPPDTEDTHQRISPDYTERLETEFVRINESLQPLETFVLPSGTPTTSQLQVCRSVCRRAERSTVALGDQVGPEIVRYLNRLSDLLFVLARSTSDDRENLWQPHPATNTQQRPVFDSPLRVHDGDKLDRATLFESDA